MAALRSDFLVDSEYGMSSLNAYSTPVEMILFILGQRGCRENNLCRRVVDLNSEPTDKKEFFCAFIVFWKFMFMDRSSLELNAAAFSVFSNLNIEGLGVVVGVLMIDWIVLKKLELLFCFIVGSGVGWFM